MQKVKIFRGQEEAPLEGRVNEFLQDKSILVSDINTAICQADTGIEIIITILYSN